MRKFSPTDIVYMLALYRHGVPIAEIQRLVPCGSSQIFYWARMYKIRTRYKGAQINRLIRESTLEKE